MHCLLDPHLASLAQVCPRVELSGVPESAVGSGVGVGGAWEQGWGDGVLSPMPPFSGI